MICRPQANLSGPAVSVAKGVIPEKSIRNVQTYLVSASEIARVLTLFQVTWINSPIMFAMLDSAKRNPAPRDQFAGRQLLTVPMLTLGASIVWFKPKEK